MLIENNQPIIALTKKVARPHKYLFWLLFFKKDCMSLSSRGCKATIKGIIRTVENKGTFAVIRTCKKVVCNGKTDYVPDFEHTVFLWDKGVQVNRGDIITIKGFYVRNSNGYIINITPLYVITEWEITCRNKYNPRYYKQKGEEEVRQTKRQQRQAIEEEIAAEEQDFDEYIENIDEDNPF